MPKIQRTMIESAIRQYLASDRVQRQRAGTIAHRERTLRVLGEVMTGMHAHEITAWHVDETMARLRKTRSESTLNIDRNNLRHFVRWLYDVQMLSPWVRPTADLSHVKPEAHSRTIEEQILTPDQALEALEVAGQIHPRERVMVALGLYGFLRESELIDLQWQHIHMEAGFIQFPRRKQHDSYHKIPIFAPLRAELEKWTAWLEEHHGPIQPTDYVIPARHAGGRGLKLNPDFPVRPSEPVFELIKCVRPIFRAIGFRSRHAGLHTFRRTGACHLFDRTRDIDLVQKMLGHSTAKTTELYLKHRDGYADLEDLAEGYDPYNQAPKQEEQPPSNVFQLRRVRRSA